MEFNGSVHRNIGSFFKDFNVHKLYPKLERSKTSPAVNVGPDPNRMSSERTRLLMSKLSKKV